MIVCKLNGGTVDVSQEVRVAQEEGLDPADSAYLDPQFAGSPAFVEGEAFVGDAVGNREITIPLIIKPTAGQTVADRVRQINTELYKGAQVEFAIDDTLPSTFFDLERGKVEVDFQYWVARSGRLRCALKLWTRPYGHTGTQRLIASVGATGMVDFAATGILGDVPALARITASRTLASRAAPGYAGGQMLAFGVHKSASYRGVLGTPTMAVGTFLTAGASGRMGSQYLGFYAVGTSTNQTMCYWPLATALRQVYAGRYRALAVLKYSFGGASPPSIRLGNNSIGALTPTMILSNPGTADFRLYDLGELAIPSAQASKLNALSLTMNFYGASGITIGASPAFMIDEVALVPLDVSAACLVRPNDAYQALASDPWSAELDAIEGQAQVWTETLSVWDDALSDLRGNLPQLPPTASAASPGPLNVTLVEGTMTTPFIAEAGQVSVSVRERFRFLR